MIDCRKLDDPNCDKNLRIHVGRNPRIMMYSGLYDGMSGFLLGENVVIMICKSGRRLSVANDELWSKTLTRYGRLQHSVSLLHLSALDFWKNTCAGKCSECIKQSTIIFQTHNDCVCAVSVHDLLPRLIPWLGLAATTTGKSRSELCWKQESESSKCHDHAS